ncbi:PREDICTED: dentin sialophosphoprotein isoform X2 [Brassica oleracea var. oleracea]|uniref:dentin sialophosphoprotein isoform X2 n=1 Tax=Brassica oleracea var. oleracea TaxID=109376 RepID=UPI0006A6B771|nr:PREDICTED: dentin sialophosphoprotein isoform X2 [Brassica oleracea var. oleracea]
MEGGGGVRLHVGGLGESVGRDDLLKIFSPMGSVEAVEFVRTKGRSFAYIDFSPASENSLTKLFSTYNGCKWKGGKLRLEKAKEHYMARLKREWAESASVSASSDDTVKAPEESPPSTHLNIFFPRLRKVKAMPLSGTGKHKYSFQRVAVPSLLPKTFCDCEEHSASLTPQETHARDVEALNVGINVEEVNIMNSVMNKLLQKDDSVISEKDDIIVDTKDNILINVVSNGKDMMDAELSNLSRKRKSMLDQTPAEGYTEGQKGNHLHPNKKRQPIIPEGSGRQEGSQAIREKKKPSEVDPDEPSRTTGVKKANDNISWSQKSSWKALVANGNSSNFSVSSFLPDVSSSKAVQPASDTDVEGSDHSESEDTDVVDSDHSESEDDDVEGSDHLESEDADVVVSDHSGSEDADIEGSYHSESEDNDGVGSDHSESEDADVDGSEHSESEDTDVADINVDAETEELAASTEGDSEDGSLNVEEDENAAENLNAENESLDHDMDEEETEKGQLEASKKSAGGSLWLQKASWTQLVRDQNASFSITQLFPNLPPEKTEADRVNNSGDGQFTYSNQSGSANGVEAAGVHGASSSTPLRSLKENQQTLKAKNVSGGSRLGVKRPIRREIGSGETCAFMRSETSVSEWKRAKKALSEPSRKKKSEE